MLDYCKVMCYGSIVHIKKEDLTWQQSKLMEHWHI